MKLASKAIKLAGSEQQQLLQDEQQFVGRQGHGRSVSQSETISANIDLIAKLRRQLEERDAEIASLKVFTPLLSGHFHCTYPACICHGLLLRQVENQSLQSVLLILQLQQAGSSALMSMEYNVNCLKNQKASDWLCMCPSIRLLFVIHDIWHWQQYIDLGMLGPCFWAHTSFCSDQLT